MLSVVVVVFGSVVLSIGTVMAGILSGRGSGREREAVTIESVGRV